jgi:hypothetical protein
MTPEEPTSAPDPQTPEETQSDQEEKASYTHSHTGFVARLPKVVRDELNQMLYDGVPYAKIIEKLGEPVKHLATHHIKTWKAGGFLEWVAEQERKDALVVRRDAAMDLVKEKATASVQDAGRSLASAQLYEFLISFDPKSLADALAEKPELYLRIISTLARLSEGEASCNHNRAREALIQAKLKLTQSTEAGKAVSPETLKEIVRLINLL